MRNFFRTACFVFFFFLLGILPAAAASPRLLSYAADGFSGTETSLFVPDEDGEFALDTTRKDDWIYTGDAARQRKRTYQNMTAYYAYLPQKDGNSAFPPSGFTELTICPDTSPDLSLYQTLCFGLSVPGTDNTLLPVTVTVHTSAATVSSVLYIESAAPPKDWHFLYVDLRHVEGTLHELSIRVDYPEEAMPSSVKCSQPYLTEHTPTGFANAERFSTDALRASAGQVTYASGRVLPDTNGRASLLGRFSLREQPLSGTRAYFEIRLTGVQSGTMQAGLLHTGMDAEQRLYSPKISLHAADGVYIIPVSVYGDVYSFTLDFENIVCDTYFTLESIRFLTAPPPPLAPYPDLGHVRSITRSDNAVIFEGSMNREAVNRFAGQSIEFFALPLTAPERLSAALPIGSTKVSTVFAYTADLTSSPSLGDTSLFFAAVRDENGDLLLLSRPRCTDAAGMPESSVSSLGLYGAPSVGAFESNVSHVLVDVPLEHLLTRKSSASLSYPYLSYADPAEPAAGTLYFDYDLLVSLDRDIQFYTSAGIQVYLRILASAPVEGITYTGEGRSYLPDLRDPDTLYAYAAVIRCLSRRYTGIAGFVLGSDVNTEEGVGRGALDNPAAYAASLAVLCRVTYNTSSAILPDVLVVVPFAPPAPDDTVWMHERTLSVLLADRLERIGPMPWVFFRTFHRAEDDLTSITALERLFSDLNLEGPGDIMFFCQPDNQYLLDWYQDYLTRNPQPEAQQPSYPVFAAHAFGMACDRLQIYAPRAVFLSLDTVSVRHEHDFYASLKQAGQSDRTIYDAAAKPAGNTRFTGSHTLWDFRQAYHTFDWIAGGGVSSCTTEPSRLSGDETVSTRVLRSVFSFADADAGNPARTGVSGIILRNFRSSFNFSRVDALNFTFSLAPLRGKAAQDITVVFVLGAEDNRAEYYAHPLPGQTQQFVCDLSGYAFRSAVDYIGIMVYADSEVCLDLTEVTVSSKTLSDTDLQAMFALADAGSIQTPDWFSLGSFLFTVMIFTVGAIVLLCRRDHEQPDDSSHTRRNP